MEESPVIKIKNVSKTYYVKESASNSLREIVYNIFSKNSSKTIKALQDIDLEIYKGECFGIIGNNGSGKSTLMNIIMGFIKPDKKGTIETIGRMMRLELGMGVDANLSARDNIYVNGSVIGLTFKQIGEKFDEIIDFADLEGFVDTPVKFYSKGMKSRLLFSIAMYAEADIFLLDEFFGGVGDQDFKNKSDAVFHEKIMEGKTIVIISHSLKTIQKHCKRCLWIDHGEIKALGETKEVLKSYKEYKRKKVEI